MSSSSWLTVSSLSRSGLLGTIHVNQPDCQLIKIQNPPASDAGVLSLCHYVWRLPYVWDRLSLWNLEVCIWLDWASSQLQGLCFCLPSSGISGGHRHSQHFGVGSGEPTSGPHDGTENRDWLSHLPDNLHLSSKARNWENLLTSWDGLKETILVGETVPGHLSTGIRRQHQNIQYYNLETF